MAITFSLVERTPYRLRYLCSQDGVVNSPPQAADGFNTIPNAGGVTPDLRTDALAGCTEAGADHTALLKIMRIRLDGLGFIAAGAIVQARARALLLSDDNAQVTLTNLNMPRCFCEITPRTGTICWTVDANVDGEGDPVVEVRSEVGVVATAYLDINLRWSFDL